MRDSDIQLWCEDEVHFQRHTSLIRMWAPRGQQPHVLSASTRQKVGFFGALNLKTGCLLTKEASTFNAETFGDFLHYLLQHTEGKIHLILDNVSWYKAQDLRDFSFRIKTIWCEFSCHPIPPNSIQSSECGESLADR
jgi:hypothetical protein